MLPAVEPPDSSGADFLGDVIIRPVSKISPAANSLELHIGLPKGYKFVEEAPFIFEVSTDDSSAVMIDSSSTRTPASLVEFPLKVISGKATLQIDMNLFYCSSGKNAVCFPKLVRLVLPVEIVKNGAPKLIAKYTVDPGL